MNDRERYEWRKARREGFLKHLVKTGLLQFGIPVAIADTVIPTVIKRELLTISLVGPLIAASLLGGILYGLLVWLINENHFKK